MLADAQPERDAEVLERFATTDLHPECVQRYRNLLASKRPDHPFLSENDTGFLAQIGAIGSDRIGSWRPTLAGLLMLGQERAIRERLPHWHLSYREVSRAPEDDDRWIDRVAPDGTWNANVFEFYLRVIGKLHAGLKIPFALDEGLFRQDETPARQAIREALINSLIHADYEGPAGIRIIRGPGDFEFINPGLLLVQAAQVWRGGISLARNPVLQRLFSLLQLGEREGSGGPAIRRAWVQQHWQVPAMWEDTQNVETHLRLRQESLVPTASVEALQRTWGQRFGALDELGRLILITAHAEGSVSHARASGLTDAHGRDVTLKLQSLMRAGLLMASGSGKHKAYTLRAPAGAKEPREAVPTSEQSPEQSPEQSAPEEVAGSSWAAKERVESAILTFCRGTWRTLPEIAKAVGRAESSVRTHYLRPLLADRRLTLKHPNSRSHPNQAYRTAEQPQ